MRAKTKAILFVALLPLAFIAFYPVPSYQDVRSQYRSSEKTVLDREGRVLQEWRFDLERRRLDWTKLENVAPSLTKALIMIEDRRFYSHSGIDVLALLALPYSWLRGKRLRGTSTISMQVAGLLNEDLRPGQPSLVRKAKQMAFALRLEASWTKKEILEAYLNLLTFRGEWQGIEAASQAIFKKAPHGLDRKEALLLASLVARPNAKAQDLARRACLYAAQWSISCPELSELASTHLGRKLAIPRREQAAMHLAPFFQGSENELFSTLDRDLQLASQKAVMDHIARLKGQNVRDAAVLLVDHQNGAVLSYVGSSGRFSEAPQVDGVQALRQAGSTLKPFLYAKALDDRLLTGETELADDPLQIVTSSGVYAPQNYDRSFRGIVRAREALADSLNIPAVRVIDLLGVDRFYDLLLQFGFGHLRDRGQYGHSLALGAVDVSLWELVRAYAALARQGRTISLRLRADDKDGPSDRVLSSAAAGQIAEILSNREARSKTFGLENPLATPYWTAVKTGTSKDMRDNWCVGFSERYTLGAWVGNFNGEPMWNVSGISGAAAIWRQIMDELHQNEESKAPRYTAAMKSRAAVSRASAAKAAPSIRYPLDQMLLAFDPDIPDDRQVLFFESDRDLPKGYSWHLDGKNWTEDHILLAELGSGRHQLELRDGTNRRIDSVSFEMRGKESR